MHIGGAHLHGHSGQPPASASAVAAKRADETRRRLFASSEELDAVATAESSWMIGAWSGAGGDSQGRGSRGDEGPPHDPPRQASSADAAVLSAGSGLSSELALEQSSIAGAQALSNPAAPASSAAGYALYAAPARVERTPEARQVSYWV